MSGELSPKSQKLHDLGERVSEVLDKLTDVVDGLAAVTTKVTDTQQRVQALESATAGRSTDSPTASDSRLVSALEDALKSSRNGETRSLAVAQTSLQKCSFGSVKGQKFEYWLQHATNVLESAGVDRSQWGTSLLSALAVHPQQLVYQRLNDAGDKADWTFDRIVDILTELYGAKETAEEFIRSLTDLHLTSYTPEALSKYRDEFLQIAANLTPEVYSGKSRCLLIEAQIPGPLRLAVVFTEDYTDPVKLFGRLCEISPKCQEECKEWWARHRPDKGKGKRSDTFVEVVSRPAKTQRTNSGPQPSRFGKPGLPEVPGKTPAEVKAQADAHPSDCIGCGSSTHRWAHCPKNTKRGQVLDALPMTYACLSRTAAPVHDFALQQAAALPDAESDTLQSSVLPGHIWRRCAKLTKPFDMLIGCHAIDSDIACLTPDEFLSSLHEGHAFINASRCTALEAKQLIVHAQNCRKRKSFSAVYLLPSGKDAAWSSLLSDVSHVARLRLTSRLHVHAHYQRVFVPDLSSWPCQIAGQEARVLNDGGSQLNLLSKQWAARQGLAVPTSSTVITLGDGSTTTAAGPLTLKLQYGAYRGDITVHVMQLTQQYDLILGNAFLVQTHAVAEYDCQGLKRLVLKKGNRKLSVNRPACGLRQESSAPLMSAMQAGRAIKRRDNFFLVRVTDSMAQSMLMAHAEVATAGGPDRIPEDRLHAIIKRFSSVLVDELPPGLPPDRGVGHVITLEKGAKPTYRPARRLSPLELAEVEAHVRKLLLNGHIEPSKSPFGANVLFVQKKDGTLRMCLDYRALNKITVQNKYPLPRIDDLIDKMAGAKCFSSLDLASGYHQIRIAEEDVPKTAFSTPFGHYQFKVLAFGLTNAPATFQYAMNELFAGQLGRYVCVYLDDILIFSKNAAEHEEHLNEVLDILEKNKFFAKLSKCDLNRSELLYLGHIVGANGIKVDPAKVSAVANWPVPEDLSQLRSFLGLTNYFRKFIQGYAERCKPLTNLTRKGIAYAWSPECQAAFEGLKQDLTTAPVLNAPDFSKAFEVVTDASQWSIGGVLMQEGRPLAYTSRKMIPAELNYTVTEQECLATVHAMKVWRCYLEGIESDKLSLVTDHNPNVHLQDQQSLSRRQVRWVEFLQRFHFKWSYRPGRLNVADPISRRAYPEQRSDQPTAHFGAATRGQRAAEGSASSVSTPGRQLPVSMNEVTVSAFQDGYRLDTQAEGLLTKGDLTASQGLLWHGDALMVPKHDSLRQDVMFNLHDASISGHPGIRRTKKLIRRYFWWPCMDTDIVSYVQTCAQCQRNKARTHAATVPLLPLEAPGKPWQSVSLDFIT